MGFLTASPRRTEKPTCLVSNIRYDFFPWWMQGLKYHFLQNLRFILEIIVSSLGRLPKRKRAINLLSTHFPNLQGDILASDFLQFCQPVIKRNQWKTQTQSICICPFKHSPVRWKSQNTYQYSVLPAGKVRRESRGEQVGLLRRGRRSSKQRSLLSSPACFLRAQAQSVLGTDS